MDWLNVFSEHRSELLHFLRGRLKNDADAQDVLQEVYLKTSKLEAKEVSNPKAYIYKIASNLAIDYQRSSSNYGRLRNRLEQEGLSGEPAPTPERACEAERRLQILQDVISALPDKCRRAFIMHRFGRKKVAEIAAELGVGKNSVEKYIIRAKRECYQAIEKYEQQ